MKVFLIVKLQVKLQPISNGIHQVIQLTLTLMMF